MESVAQVKISVNGKHSIFRIFDWRWPDVEPAPREWKGTCNLLLCHKQYGVITAKLNMTNSVPKMIQGLKSFTLIDNNAMVSLSSIFLELWWLVAVFVAVSARGCCCSVSGHCCHGRGCFGSLWLRLFCCCGG